jgi:hypothetical protein
MKLFNISVSIEVYIVRLIAHMTKQYINDICFEKIHINIQTLPVILTCVDVMHCSINGLLFSVCLISLILCIKERNLICSKRLSNFD